MRDERKNYENIRWDRSSTVGEHFLALSGQEQRACLLGASLKVAAYQLSSSYGKVFSQEEVVQEKFEELVEKIAARPQEVERLVRFDSYSLYLHPLSKDREMFWLSLACSQALELDRSKLPLQLKLNFQSLDKN